MVQNTGKGLTSSWILSNPDYGLAVVDNADLGLTSFHGRDVTTDSLIVAPALLGDANLDGTVNFADLLKLAQNYGASAGTWAVGDFNADRMVNIADLSLTEQQYGASEEDFAAAWALARSLVPLSGDYNGDGVVDAADYVVWRKGIGVEPTTDNYNYWRTHFGQTAGGGSVTNSHGTVPEPATLVMLIVTAAGVFTRRGVSVPSPFLPVKGNCRSIPRDRIAYLVDLVADSIVIKFADTTACPISIKSSRTVTFPDRSALIIRSALPPGAISISPVPICARSTLTVPRAAFSPKLYATNRSSFVSSS